MLTTFTNKAILLIQNIPKGKVLTYGIIASLAGNPKGARQVSWLLHSSSNKYSLPWHRVINSKGTISLKSEEDYIHQKSLLESEGIVFIKNKILLNKYLWDIKSMKAIHNSYKLKK